MPQPRVGRRSLKQMLGGLALSAAAGLTGCQVDIGGQTLPSPYWQTDDVQYFPAGPEFKLSREAAAMNAYRDDALRAGLGAEPIPAGPPVPVVPPGDLPPDVIP